MKKEKAVRNSSFELLRIFMMLQVIFLHVCDPSKGGYTTIAKSLPRIDFDIFYSTWLLNRCPIYIFMILTGYFLCQREMSFKDVKKRILKIWIPMLFFSIALSVGGALIGFWSFKSINYYQMFTPTLSCSWYFLTGYIILIVLSPFLNKLIKSMSKKEYLCLLVIITFILSIWTPLSKLPFFKEFISTFQNISNNAGKSVYDYIFMYLLGGYLKMHVNIKKKNDFKWLLGFIALGAINFVLVVYFKDYRKVAAYNDNLFVVLQCICLMNFFASIKFQSKIINYIASYMLAVYIIHEHFLLKWYIWQNIFKIDKSFFSSKIYLLKILGICLAIMIGCIIIEFLRRCLFKICEIIIAKITSIHKKSEC